MFLQNFYGLGSVGVTEFLQPGRTLGLQDFCGLGGFRGCRTSAVWEEFGVAEFLQPGRSLGIAQLLRPGRI